MISPGGRDWFDCLTLTLSLFGLLLSIMGVIVLSVYTLVTAIQAWLTRKVLAETQRSNEAAQKSNELTNEGLRMQREAFMEANRARLSITSGPDSPEHAQLAPGPVEVIFNLKNGGLGCATDVVVKSGYLLFNEQLEDCRPIEPTDIVLRRSSFPYGANVALRFRCGSLSEDDVSALNEQKKWLYVLGLITYRDGVGNWRETRVCAYYRLNPKWPGEPWEFTHFCNKAT